MKTTHRLAEERRRRKRPPVEVEPATTGQRLHGDSYGDVIAREDELAGTSSTHVAASDRRLEEPSDAQLGSTSLPEL